MNQMTYLESLKAQVGTMSLSHDQIMTAYRYQEMLFNMEDAEHHLRDYFEERLDDTDAIEKNMEILKSNDSLETLAEQFLDAHDCNLDDNSIWNNLIVEYVSDYGAELGLATD